MKILLTGPTGQVGWELMRSLLPLGEIITVDRRQADFNSPDSLRPLVRENRPDVIINAAAYTKVDQAEDEEDTARRINSDAPAILAEEAGKIRSLLIHYSTDYVFDGEKRTPYTETDSPNPLNAYGRTKLWGEQSIQASGCNFLILRTSWVYSARGNNFVRTMLRLFEQRQELKVVSDQYGTPTWARLVSDVTAQILPQIVQQISLDRYQSDIFNLTAAGETSWFDFAEAVKIEAMRTNPVAADVNIRPISSSRYQQKAKRPVNSRLSVNKLSNRFGLALPAWMDCLHLCINDIVETGKLKE